MKRTKKFICVLIVMTLMVELIAGFVFAETKDRTVLTDFTEYYGRSALEKLPNAEAMLYAYDNIAKGVEASLDSISVYNGKNYISVTELQIVLDAYMRDYAHHFWLDKEYSYYYYGNSSRVITYVPKYTMSGATLENAKEAFVSAADEILAYINDSMTDYEKELVLHDELVKRVVYDLSAPRRYDPYGALVEGKAVCEGYAEAFQYLLHRAGIHSFLVIGSSRGVGHEWNIVRIDGEYYHVDPTWNDQGDTIYHAYFNMSDAYILEDHAIDATVYEMPACDSMDAHYFTVNGNSYESDEYTTDEVAEIFKKTLPNAHFFIKGNVNEFIQWYCDNIMEIAEKVGIVGSYSRGYATLGREVVLVLDGEVTDSEYVLEYGKCTTDEVAKILQKSHPEAVVYVRGDLSAFVQWYYDNITEIAEKAGVVGQFRYGYSYFGREITLILDGEYVESEYAIGDVNGDGNITNADVLAIYRYIYNPALYPINIEIGDVNKDGNITNADVLAIYRYIYNPELYPLG